MANLEKGIYLEVKRAPSHESNRVGFHDYGHAYLVYRDGKGGERVLRGGPEEYLGLLGDIAVQDRPLKGSKDQYDPSDPQENRWIRKIDLKGRDPEQVWKIGQREGNRVHANGYDYNAARAIGRALAPNEAKDIVSSIIDRDQNSNSVIASVLKAMGVDLEDALPEGVKEDQLPGIKNTLSHAPDENPFSASEQLRKNQGKAWDSKHRQTRPEPEKPKADTKGAVPTPEQRKAFRHSKPVTAPDRPKPKAEGAPPTVQQKKADPAAQKMLDDFLEEGTPADEALLKPVSKWTEAESEAVMKKRMSLSPSDPDYDRYVTAEKAYFDTRYGKGAAKMDETGKLIQPQPKGSVPTTTAAVKTPDGQTLDKALSNVGKHVVAQAENHSTPKAVKGLQTGLNLMADATQTAPLKTDGIAGPKTVQATRTATAKLGAPKVKEAAALGTLAEAARDPALTSNPDALKATIDSTVGPLFGKDAPAQSNAWGRGVQAAVNDTGADVLGSTFQPIKEDGWIGPKTAQAFGQIASAAAPMDFAKRLGMGLGFV